MGYDFLVPQMVNLCTILINFWDLIFSGYVHMKKTTYTQGATQLHHLGGILNNKYVQVKYTVGFSRFIFLHPRLPSWIGQHISDNETDSRFLSAFGRFPMSTQWSYCLGCSGCHFWTSLNLGLESSGLRGASQLYGLRSGASHGRFASAQLCPEVLEGSVATQRFAAQLAVGFLGDAKARCREGRRGRMPMLSIVLVGCQQIRRKPKAWLFSMQEYDLSWSIRIHTVQPSLGPFRKASMRQSAASVLNRLGDVELDRELWQFGQQKSLAQGSPKIEIVTYVIYLSIYLI